MSDTPKTKKALIVSDFNDAGTGASYVAGNTHFIETGAHANYEAAGLVSAPPPEKTKSVARPKRPAKAKTAAKPSAKPVDDAKAPEPAAAAQPDA